MNTYEINGNTVTLAQWNLLAIISTGKFHELSDKKGYFSTKNEELPGTARRTYALLKSQGGPEFAKELNTLINMGMLQINPENNFSYKITPAAERVGFQHGEEPLVPGARRPIITGSYRDCDSPEVRESLSQLAAQGYKANLTCLDKITEEVENGNLAFPKAKAVNGGVTDGGKAQALAGLKRLYSKGDKVLFSDVFIDWRGRVNHQTGIFGSFQQNKLQRAIMEAPEAVAVAVDSPEWDYMLQQFAHEGITLANYKAALVDPITSGSKALEYRMALAIEEIITTGQTAYMIEQDASCSGGQIIALLTGDEKLARAVNLIEGTERQDIYSDLMVNDEFAPIWERNTITTKDRRNLAKPVIMVSFYGGGDSTILASIILDHLGYSDSNRVESDVVNGWAKMFYEGMDEGDDEKLSECARIAEDMGFTTITAGASEISVWDIAEIVKICGELLIHMYPGFKAFKSWGQSNSSKETKRQVAIAELEGTLLQKNGIEVEWVTPNGLTVAHDAMSPGGLMPNFIHSLDGCVVQRTISDEDMEGASAAYVHDAFFTTINNAKVMATVVRNHYHGVIQDAMHCIPNWGGKELACNEEGQDRLLSNINNALVLGA